MKRKREGNFDPKETKRFKSNPKPSQSAAALAIAQAFKRGDSLSLAALKESLPQPLTMDTISSLLCQVSLLLKKNWRPADNLKQTINELVALGLSDTEHHLSQNTEPDTALSDWLKLHSPERHGQCIAFVIYNCGKIAGSPLDLPVMSAKALMVLLQALKQTPIRSSKAIANSLYGIGLLIKAHRLKGAIDSADIEVLLEQLQGVDNLDAQSISNSLYGLGLLAQAGQLHGVITAKNLNTLLKRLDKLGGLTTQNISNNLYGLGLLAKAGYLQGAIAAESLSALLKRLHGSGSLDVQGISNSLYGLGLLAQAGQVQGTVAAESLSPLLEQVPKLGDLTIQGISNNLYGLGLLAQAGRLKGIIAVESLNLLLERVPKLDTCTSQGIGNSLYGLGLLAQAGQLKGTLAAESLSDLLERLHGSGNLDTQHISISIYGLGLLAQAGQLQGAIAAEGLSVLLKRVSGLGNLDSLHISISFYGLGLLAQAGQLQGAIAAEGLSALLKRVPELGNLNSQHISNSLYGLGLLAQAGQLQGAIAAESLSALFKRLPGLGDLDTQEISISIYGIGLLAQAGQLQGTVAAECLSVLVNRLPGSGNLDTQHISISFYGLGVLAQAGQLQGAIAAESLSALLKQLPGLGNLDAQHISNSLYGLGLLAQAGQLQGAIAAESLSILLKRLPGLGNLDAQGISNSLYGLGLLAQADQLQGAIAAESLSILLKQLLRLSNLTIQSISSSLYGLGLLAKAGQLQGAIAAEILSILLKRVTGLSDLDAQGISNSLYGLGLLAQAGQLQGAIAAESLSALLNRLPGLGNLDTQHISNSLHSSGLLATTGRLAGLLPTTTVERLLTRLQQPSPTALNARQTLSALAKLKPCFTQALSPEAMAIIKTLFAVSLNVSYLHPSLAAELINAMVAFKAYTDERMTPLFLEAIESLGLPLACFSQEKQTQLQANLAALASHPAWERQLAQQLGLAREPAPVITPVIAEVHEPSKQPSVTSSQPHAPEKRPALRGQSLAPKSSSNPATYYSQACHNQLFSAIDKRDEDSLRRLLALGRASLAAPTHSQRSTKSSSEKQTERQAAPKLYSAEQLVLDFFNQTNKQALRELIAKSEKKPFVLALQACSAHARYQLVQTQALHPLFIHLPFNELGDLVNTLISPFQIYRDHQALLQLIDALTIRKAKEHSKAKEIKDIQLQLLAEGLQFHQKCGHIHVVDRLTSTQTKIKENRLTLLDDNDHDEIPSPVRTQSALSKPPVRKPSSAQQPANSKTTVLKSNVQEVNNKYEYETEDIQAILAARVSVYTKVHVLAVAQMDAQIAGNWVTEVLSGFIDKEGMTLELNNQKCHLLIPIQDEGHWIGLMVTLQGKHCQQLTYFNSLNQGLKDKERMDSLQDQLEQIDFANQNIRVQPPRQPAMLQCDGTSCGPLMIENFYCALKGEMWAKTITNEMTQAMRKRHLEVLKDKRPDYYPDFKRRQANNIITIPEIALQLQSHGLFPGASTQRPEKILPALAHDKRRPG